MASNRASAPRYGRALLLVGFARVLFLGMPLTFRRPWPEVAVLLRLSPARKFGQPHCREYESILTKQVATLSSG